MVPTANRWLGRGAVLLPAELVVMRLCFRGRAVSSRKRHCLTLPARSRRTSSRWRQGGAVQEKKHNSRRLVIRGQPDSRHRLRRRHAGVRCGSGDMPGSLPRLRLSRKQDEDRMRRRANGWINGWPPLPPRKRHVRNSCPVGAFTQGKPLRCARDAAGTTLQGISPHHGGVHRPLAAAFVAGANARLLMATSAPI
jgi:hypothetical protein